LSTARAYAAALAAVNRIIGSTPCDDRRVKVNTPLGEYPFEYRGIERRGRTVVISGTVAGLESSVNLGGEDLAAVIKPLALPLAAAVVGALLLLRARR
jgi:hypothetical protein